jgi:hypothetical protein
MCLAAAMQLGLLFASNRGATRRVAGTIHRLMAENEGVHTLVDCASTTDLRQLGHLDG